MTAMVHDGPIGSKVFGTDRSLCFDFGCETMNPMPDTLAEISPFPKKILLGLQEGRCNLKCPKCYTHGSNAPSNQTRSSGIMDFGLFQRILEESRPHRPRIAPQTWDEPLLNPRFLDYAREIKRHDLVITMDTNGFLLTDDLMRAFIDIELDSVFVSLDAFSRETLLKTRGVSNLEFLSRRVLRFLELRGAKTFPRIGVSFVIEDTNSHELEAFVDHWTQSVDVVRTNALFTKDRSLPVKPHPTRRPCWSLWDSLMIHHDGSAALCCADTHYQVEIGNVRDSSVEDVWNGHVFRQARRSHLDGAFSKVSICGSCDLWSNDEPVTERRGDLLVSSTTTHTYFNRLDRLGSVPETNRYIGSAEAAQGG
jgi:radical SAM protein with 4Fe4S-binding SPASM domain